MKKIIKMLAMALALVMLVSLIPAGTVSAAAKKPSLNNKTKVLFVGGSKVNPSFAEGTYVLQVKNRPSKYAVTWTSSDASVATVQKNKYKGTVTAVSVGTCTITAVVTDKTSKPYKKTTLTCKVTVKANCAAVDITPAKVADVEVGAKVELTGTMYNAAAKAVTTGKEVTDTLKWFSSDTAVAVVNNSGVVTAVAPGTATITCYAVQSTTGTYAQLSKAVAQDSVTITVKNPPVKGIVSIKQLSLNKIQVELGKDFSALDKSNFKLVRNLLSVDIDTVTFDKTGTVATITTKSELTASSKYTLKLVGSDAEIGTEGEFTTSNGQPASLSLYTGINGNQVVAEALSEIYFKLYDASGVDITPLSKTSTAYVNYDAYISCSSKDVSGNYFVNGRNILIYDKNKAVNVIGTYNDYKGTTFTAALTVVSVSEASTVKYIGATVTKSSKSGADLDFDTPKYTISQSDYGEGYRLVAKVQKGDGTYVYSDEVGTKISFSYADSNSLSAVFINAEGSLNPFAQGTDNIIVKYDGEAIGVVQVSVGPERTPVRIETLVDNAAASMVTLSDADVTNPSISIRVYDNYGEVYPLASASGLTLTSTDNSAPPAYASSVNADGTANVTLFALGSGNVAGKAYTYIISYAAGSYTVNGVITARISTPNTSLSSSYKAVTVGKTDLKVDSSFDVVNGSNIKISLVEYKGDVRYQDINMKTKAACASGDYYAVVTDPSGNEVTTTINASGAVVVPTVKIVGTTITKSALGTYTYRVYKKGLVVDTTVSAGQFTLTDSQEGAKAEQISKTTTVYLRSTSTQSEIDMAFAQCFKVTLDGNTAIATVTEKTVSDGGMYISKVSVTGTIVIGGNSYTLTYPLAIGKVIQSVY